GRADARDVDQVLDEERPPRQRSRPLPRRLDRGEDRVVRIAPPPKGGGDRSPFPYRQRYRASTHPTVPIVRQLHHFGGGMLTRAALTPRRSEARRPPRSRALRPGPPAC